MTDPKIQNLKLQGNYYLWSYKPEHKSNSGIHFTCSEVAIESFSDLIKAMIESQWASQKEIQLSKTSSLQINICGSNGKSYKSLVIKHDKQLPNETFEVNKQDEQVTLVLSTDSLKLLNKSVARIKLNEGDYSIGDSTPFWFWWNLEE